MKSLPRLLAAIAASLLAPLSMAEMGSRQAAPMPLAVAPLQFVAPDRPARALVSLPAPPAEKAQAASQEEGGRLRVGSVRALEKAATGLVWTRVAGGHVARFTARSEGAAGLRVRLDLGTLPGTLELRAQGTDGVVERMTVDPWAGTEAWTPWTAGDTQTIELLSTVRPAEDVMGVGAVLHMTSGPYEKAAGSCTIHTACPTGDGVLDAAIGERKRSVMRLSFVDSGGGFVCSGTMINTDHFPAPYVLTANHCIATAASAATLTTLWFYEAADCAGLAGVKAGQVQVAGGSQVVLTNKNVDSTLLLLDAPAPQGAVHSGWSTTRLGANAAIVSISHPAGDTSRLAQGNVTREYRIIDHPHDMYGVRFSNGIIEGGSSGSGLFRLSAGSLQLTGVLSGTTIRNAGGLSCTNLDEEGLYGRFEVFGPQIAPYVRLPQRSADDAPNRISEVAGDAAASLDTDANGVDIAGRRIDYAGDLDLYRFTIDQASYVSVSTYGANLDTVGSILDSQGESLETEDDAQRGDTHFGITRQLQPGTYYVQVGHWEAEGTGDYNLRLHAARVNENYTDLWWNAAESGWGINFNHQGNVLFGTLFTYDAQGAPMWLVMSGGARQPDGAFQGELYRASGPVFNAVPFTGVALTPVGTMRVSFPTASSGSLAYTVDGRHVTKSITRQSFRTLPTCTWSGFDRSYASNYQDLWWNPGESGWGVNIAHQEDILFATLFTYDANRQPVWYVMSQGSRSLSGSYSGTLYRTRGPAFDATPWTPVSITPVGSMSFTFDGGNAATMTYTVDGIAVTKQIQRQVFAEPRTSCTS